MKTMALALGLCAASVWAGAQIDAVTSAVFYDRGFESAIREALALPVGVVTEQDLAALTELTAPDSDIASLEGIQLCTNLRTLDISGNRITELKPLIELLALNDVDVSGNRIGDLSPLVIGAGLGEGDTLNVEGNPLTQPSICKYIPSLQRRGVVVAYTGRCSADSDGDGLSDETEAVLGTDPALPDTDTDGIPDGFEVGRGLDPLSAEDALLDSDEDGLTNLQEFHSRSDPFSAASPAATFFVSPQGDDGNDGSLGQPWQTIEHALTQTAGYATANIALFEGTYRGNIELNPGTRLVGIRPDVVVQGFIIGNQSTAIANLEVTEMVPAITETPPLLSMFDCAMAVLNVTFRGAGGRLARGIAVTGDTPAVSLISNCSFTGLRIGVDIFGAIPRIRRSSFDTISGSAIVFRFINPKNSADGDGTYAPTDGNSGYNSFTNIEGEYVINMRPERIDMRNNYWGTEDPDEIAELVSGEIDTSSHLKSSGLAPATVTCSLWDAETMAPITSGSIFLAPGAFLPLTENSEGVYTMACVPAGDYTVTATAAGYVHISQSVSLESGDAISLVFPMQPGEDEPDGGCFASTSRWEPAKPGASALFAVAAALIAAALWKRRPRRISAR